VRGEIEKDNNVLVIKRIFVTLNLKVAPEHRETAQRVHGFYADYCPVARTIRGCVEIQTTLNMLDLDA
jgi:organic hydroperoxide reductase OsmC/OhrA